MKKLFFMLTLSLGVGYFACAQKTPPVAVTTAFNQRFSNVKELEWGLEKSGEWEAEFEQNGAEMSASYSAGGKWLETETGIKIADLPAPVLATLKGKKVTEAARIVRADGSTTYEAEVAHHDLLFDASGKALNK